MKVITTESAPIKMWLNDIEDGALEQAKNLANLPFLHKHVAIMPDSHQGYGMPIGGVIATKGVIIPNAVGVDIGCGMCAVKTSLTEISQDDLKKILGEIRKDVPVGFKKHGEQQDLKLMPEAGGGTTDNGDYDLDNVPIVDQNYKNARKSLGTLGGGNHFIEIQKGDDGHIWIMIHSGSRNLGFQVANHYNKVAEGLNKKWHTSVDPKHELAFLPIGSNEAIAYVNEMNYCVEYALANRGQMMSVVEQIISEAIEDVVEFDKMINIAHNYASIENHYGENVWVHRKGATSAKAGEIGIVPGSQGTSSYIVEGLGNKESFMSCSHGAGRKLGRKDAQRTLDLDEEVKKLDDQGILHGIRGKGQLDEAPGAYKDIDVVMDNQKDLVKILVKLTPLAVVKG